MMLYIEVRFRCKKGSHRAHCRAHRRRTCHSEGSSCRSGTDTRTWWCWAASSALLAAAAAPEWSASLWWSSSNYCPLHDFLETSSRQDQTGTAACTRSPSRPATRQVSRRNASSRCWWTRRSRLLCRSRKHLHYLVAANEYEQKTTWLN